MLPVNEIVLGYSEEEIATLLELYEWMRQLDDDHPGILVKSAPGIVFKPDHFTEQWPLLVDVVKRYPFLKNKCSFIVTNQSVSHFKPHSDDSHGSVFALLESDGTTETKWYKINNTPAFVFSNDLYGCVSHPDANLTVRHSEILQQGKTYLFDSHTFHSVKNESHNRRIVFTWWLEHIAYHPAYEYYREHGLVR